MNFQHFRLDSGYTSSSSENTPEDPNSESEPEDHEEVLGYFWPETPTSPDLRPRNAKSGLIDLDLTHPCTSNDPCLLDKLIQEDIIKNRGFNNLVQQILHSTRNVILQLEEQGF